jgi:muramidase (phage lysozyme)
MIRIGEGTIQEDGYRTMFTGAKFTDFSKHPNTRHEANGVVSTAAGAYHFYTGHGEICNDILSQISVRVIKSRVV